jgi:hypothetical protein
MKLLVKGLHRQIHRRAGHAATRPHGPRGPAGCVLRDATAAAGRGGPAVT